MPPVPRPSRAYLACQAAGWGVYAVGNVVLFANWGAPVGRTALVNALYAAWGALATHAMRRRILREDWLRLPLGRLVAHVLVASVALGIALTLMLVAILRVFRLLPPEAPFWVVASSTLFNMTILSLVWLAIYLGVGFVRRSREAEIAALRYDLAAKDARFGALQAQVNPHFLFNSLNGVRGLIVEDPPRAQEMVTHLSALLRYSLRSGEEKTVPLGTEMEAVADYLALEKLRFESRLDVVLDVPPDATECRVPPMLVQTLVENALKHGIGNRRAGGRVAVRASRHGAHLVVEVENDGPWIETGGGTGLANARERLRLLFGDDASLSVVAGSPDSALVRVTVPA